MARRFGLGRPVAEPVRVPGGLSNEMWRLETSTGVFAVKRMIANAGRSGFAGNVEAACRIEQRAWAAGVPMPEPIPDPGTGREIPVRPWIFGWWVSSQREWRDYNATRHPAEAARTERRLLKQAAVLRAI